MGRQAVQTGTNKLPLQVLLFESCARSAYRTGERNATAAAAAANRVTAERTLNVLIELIKVPSHVFTFHEHDTRLHATRLPLHAGSDVKTKRRTTQ